MRAEERHIRERRENYREQRDPHHLTFGPKTRREFLLFSHV
jgi:hypothetical protein